MPTKHSNNRLANSEAGQQILRDRYGTGERADGRLPVSALDLVERATGIEPA